jgi:hypothetical protein
MKTKVEIIFTESNGHLQMSFPELPTYPWTFSAQMKKRAAPSDPEAAKWDWGTPFGKYVREPMTSQTVRRAAGIQGRSQWGFRLTEPAGWDGKGSKPGGTIMVWLGGANMTDQSVLDVTTLPRDEAALKTIFDDPASEIVLFYKQSN